MTDIAYYDIEIERRYHKENFESPDDPFFDDISRALLENLEEENE